MGASWEGCHVITQGGGGRFWKVEGRIKQGALIFLQKVTSYVCNVLYFSLEGHFYGKGGGVDDPSAP